MPRWKCFRCAAATPFPAPFAQFSIRRARQLLSVDTVTAIALSHDQPQAHTAVELDALLPALMAAQAREAAAAPAAAVARSGSAVARVAAAEAAEALFDDDDEASDGGGESASASDDSAADDSAARSKHERYARLVRQLAESFPHVPLDSIWTAVITRCAASPHGRGGRCALTAAAQQGL